MDLRIYTDGASRGNPGPAAIAFTIHGPTGEKVEEFSEFIGQATNNEAEYRALVAALERARALTDGSVVCHTDSQLVVRQIDGEYRIRAGHLVPLVERIKVLCREFEQVDFKHLPRSHQRITAVDALANQALDREGH